VGRRRIGAGDGAEGAVGGGRWRAGAGCHGWRGAREGSVGVAGWIGGLR
jgi:hypothetical protein